MISVGFSRTDCGTPVMREKAYPSSEQIFFEDGPSKAQEALDEGRAVFFDGMPGEEHLPQRRYSHSSSDL